MTAAFIQIIVQNTPSILYHYATTFFTFTETMKRFGKRKSATKYLHDIHELISLLIQGNEIERIVKSCQCKCKLSEQVDK